MNEAESVVEYFTKLLTITNQIKTIGEIQVKELQGSLEEQEMRMNERSNIEQALKAQTSRKNDGGSSKNKKGKGKWMSNKWQNTGAEQRSATDQNHNESKNNKNGSHDKYCKKKFNKGIQCYNCQK